MTTSGKHRIEKHLRNGDAYNRGKEPDILNGHEDKKKQVVLQLTVCCFEKTPGLSSRGLVSMQHWNSLASKVICTHSHWL